MQYTKVDPKNCASKTQPEVVTEVCSTKPCPPTYKWNKANQYCSLGCGKGKMFYYTLLLKANARAHAQHARTRTRTCTRTRTLTHASTSTQARTHSSFLVIGYNIIELDCKVISTNKVADHKDCAHLEKPVLHCERDCKPGLTPYLFR